MLVNRIVFSINDHPEYHGLSLYFQGCDAVPKCPKCHNPETWDFDPNYFFTYEHVKQKIIDDLDFLLSSYPKVGFAFLGGEPLAPEHISYVSLLSMEIKYLFREKVDIILYSWRMPEDLLKEKLLKSLGFIDRFVLGRFDYKQLNVDENGKILFPASKNQLYLTVEELILYIAELKKEH